MSATTPRLVAPRTLEEIVLEEMARIVAPCVQPTTTTLVFTRCYDVHSSIHAHWAVYRIALHGVAMHLPLVSQAALEPHKLNAEVPRMQTPYAAAWFLRLAIDYEKWARSVGASGATRLRAVGDQMAAWLKSYHDSRTIHPYTREYANPGWTLSQLHAYYAFTGDTKLADQVSMTIRRVFVVPILSATFATDLNSPDFFSIVGNWYYVVARTQSRQEWERFLAMQAPIPNSHLVVNNLSAVHSYGMSWSRLWAFRAISGTTSNAAEAARFRAAADLHIVEGLKRHVTLRGNFAAYDHWVPQFAVYAMTEPTGR